MQGIGDTYRLQYILAPASSDSAVVMIAHLPVPPPRPHALQHRRVRRTGPSLHDVDAPLADGDISFEPKSGPCIGRPESSRRGRVRVRRPEKGWMSKTALALTPRLVCANVQVFFVGRG